MSANWIATQSSRLLHEAARRFGVSEDAFWLARAPYRICPLGAHIDHQHGPVTAMALDRATLLAFLPSGDASVRLASLDFPVEAAFSLEAIPPPVPGDWGNFPRGAAMALSGIQALERGIVGLASGPLHGGGVSSSAALGIACLLALESANSREVDPAENARLGRKIENEYLGLRSGILDQAAILHSKRGHLTHIDCRSGRHALVRMPESIPRFHVLLAFSGLRKALVGTDYNRRVDECVEAARILLAAVGRSPGSGVAVLGDVTAEEYAARKDRLEGPPARRAAHFFGEVERVRQGLEAWRRGDLPRFGSLMTASGESSIVHYECGSPPLVDLHRILARAAGVLGTRFSGAGFRGCCVALVASGAIHEVRDRVAREYGRLHPELVDHAEIVVCGTDDGAQVIPPRASGSTS